ncbi:MAG: hypothetical protein ACOY82_10295 [Pseudomonadota bacterium]
MEAKPAIVSASFDPFPQRETVSVAELFAAVAAEATAIADSPVVREEYAQLRTRHALPDDAGLYADYVRIRIAFEATRAGGLWGLEWRVTDRLPQSDRIWAQWRSTPVHAAALPTTTAIAECDELSALFAVVARGIGLSRRSQVGLFWPTSNHTVAVWVVEAQGRAPARIVVPTSQIFLDSAQSLDTDRFDPWGQKRIFDYTRRDVAADVRLPAALARHFVARVRAHGAESRGALQTRRNRQEYEQRMAAARESASR